METFVVVLGLVVVPACVAAVAVALVTRRRPVAATVPVEDLLRESAEARAAERDAAVKAAVDHLVRMNEQMLAGERRLGAQDLEGKKSLIDHELVGMRGDLQRLTSLVTDIEKERRQHVGELASQLREAGRSTQVLAETTQSLREALSSTTARGQWGERMADDVLRLAGFVDGVNYRRRQAITGSGTGAGGVPDYTFLLPQGLSLHMDVKFPLNNYLKYLDATSDVERERWRKEFLRDVRLRLKEVTTRDYDTGGDTVDCVLLFIPNEAVYAFIQEQDRTLLDDALRDKVVFCSPLTLYAVLAVIRQAVDNFRLSQTTQEILGLLQGFEKQWSKFVDQMDKVGRNLKTVSNAFDELEGSRRRMLERELDKIDAVRRQQQLDGAPDDATVTRLALEA
ncbi:MAG TPA: DNA recombination protein RmuC [Acidimicrobiia bacterium]|jgi:DNA recombination protein RmuC